MCNLLEVGNDDGNIGRKKRTVEWCERLKFSSHIFMMTLLNNKNTERLSFRKKNLLNK